MLGLSKKGGGCGGGSAHAVVLQCVREAIVGVRVKISFGSPFLHTAHGAHTHTHTHTVRSTAANTPGVGGSSDLDSFVDTIVMTFRHFLETPEFFEIIVSRFRSSRRSAERMRAVSILCAWAELFWFVDFCGQPLLADFVAFVDDVKADAEEHLFVKQITRFNYYINNHSAPGRGADGGTGGGAGGGSSASPRPDSMVAIHVSEIYFLSLDAEDVAKQMTLSDCALMRAIKPSEFVVQLWEDTDSDPRMAALTTNLNAFIERFNRTSYWVETGVVVCLCVCVCVCVCCLKL